MFARCVIQACNQCVVSLICMQTLKDKWDSDMYRVERVYGSHAAWEKRMDRAVLSQARRLPGIPSSFSGLDTIMGRDDKIGFEDFLSCT